MPRIRSLWPSYWSSVTLTALPRDARSTFQGLWNYADDEGRGICDLRLLKAFIWPADDDITLAVLEGYLELLEKAGVIVRYRTQTERNERCYYAITHWSEHQHPDKPKPSKYPKPPGVRQSRRVGEASGKRQGAIPVGREGRGVGEGKGVGSGVKTPPIPAAAVARARGLWPAEPPSPNEFTTTTAIDEDPRVRQLASGMDRLGASALVGYLRAARDPERLLLEFGSIVNGSHGPGGKAIPPPVLGRALHDMAVAGAKCTSRILGAFVLGVEAQPPPRSRASPAESEWAERKRKEAERVGAS